MKAIFVMYLRHLRNYSQNNVRVRFAPSPTGYLHLGGLRTALYNYVYARLNKGKFILRIEDTDQARMIPGAETKLIEDLVWVGLIPDEGPHIGGNYGPYIQSERAELYRKEVEKLIENGYAYHCFCSERRLNLLRKDALRNRQIPKYDNHCRSLTSEEVEKRLSEGQRSCIRFKLGTSEPFKDMVYGRICHGVEEIEGDLVILKTDGLPTYHLANVVDDHHMKISHVIRGVEWLQSTNKHIMIYRAFGYNLPSFMHLPLLLNSDGSKMSKRQESLTVEAFRKQGIQPRALINFLIKAGSGFHINQEDINCSLEEITSKFDPRLINSNSCRLPMERLPQFNRLELKRKANDKRELILLVDEVRQKLVQKCKDSIREDLEMDDMHISRILNWSLPRISNINDLFLDDMLFLWKKPNYNSLEGCTSETFKILKDHLNGVKFERERLNQLLKTFSQHQHIPFKKLMELLRIALSGTKKGPSVAEIMEILGREITYERLKCAENFLKQP